MVVPLRELELFGFVAQHAAHLGHMIVFNDVLQLVLHVLVVLRDDLLSLEQDLLH